MSAVKDFVFGKKPDAPKPPPPPANTPTRADAANDVQAASFQSLLSRGGSGTGLKRRAATSKRSLIGGSA